MNAAVPEDHAEQEAGTTISRPKRLTADRAEIAKFVEALFMHAPDGGFVSCRAFPHRSGAPAAFIEGVRLDLEEDGLGYVVQEAAKAADRAARHHEPAVFCPPIALFSSRKRARAEDLVAGLALSVECDERPSEIRQLLEGLLGLATVVVASGGLWIDPETGIALDKVHLHWRLSEPTTNADSHADLRRARKLAALITGSDATAVPIVHPLRWPGSWHTKNPASPRLSLILEVRQEREVHLDDILEVLEAAAIARGIEIEQPIQSSGGPQAPVEDDDLAALVEAIPNKILTWAEWNAVGLALWGATQGSDQGATAFDAWSAKSDKYDARETAARWAHYRTSPPRVLGIRKLVYLARVPDPAFRLPSWDKVATAVRAEGWPTVLARAIEEMNERFFVVPLGGSVVIGQMLEDPALGRSRLVASRETDIRLLFAPRHYKVGETQAGRDIVKSLGEAWIGDCRRRTYSRAAMVTDGPCPAGTLNLWRGFGIDPKPGSSPLIEDHLLQIVCAGRQDYFAWLIHWMARCVQQPGKQAEVAVVLRGLKGTGKGICAQIMARIFRHHAIHISNSRHLVGNFNAHLMDGVFLFLDEAFWAGDKSGEGVLKTLITERTVMIEPKGIDSFQMPNRLKIMMASNNDWVVPASGDERRYFVLDISEARKGDRAYFSSLAAAIEGDELPGFLNRLLSVDLSDFDHRNPPHTEGLNKQKLIGASTLRQFWHDCLWHVGIVGTPIGEWPTDVVVQHLHSAYLEYAVQHGDRYPLSDARMARELSEILPDRKPLKTIKPRGKPYGNIDRPNRYILPDLGVARAAFLTAMNINEEYEWPVPEEEP